MLYKAIPHTQLQGKGGEIIHFSEESFHLTELTQAHVAVLERFSTGTTIEEAVQQDPGSDDLRSVIKELVELELISPVVSTPVYQRSIDPQQKIMAFRIVLTEQCNLNCVGCFVRKYKDKLRTMRPEVLDSTVRQTIAYGANNAITYHFFGGEPLIRFDYIERAVEILEEAVRQGVIVQPRYSVTTNLTLLDNAILSFFAKHGFKVGVSVDGPEDIHDQLRVYKSGEGSFRKVAQNYLRLTSLGVDSHLLVTPHPDYILNQPEILQKVLEQFPTKSVTINTPFDPVTLRWTIEGRQYAQLLIDLLRIAKKAGVNVDSAISPPLRALSEKKQRLGPCGSRVSVGPDGNISYCSQKWFPDLGSSPTRLDDPISIPIRRPDQCAACASRHICGGPCPAFQQISGESLDENRCSFMKETLKQIALNLDLFEEV